MFHNQIKEQTDRKSQFANSFIDPQNNCKLRNKNVMAAMLLDGCKGNEARNNLSFFTLFHESMQ